MEAHAQLSLTIIDYHELFDQGLRLQAPLNLMAALTLAAPLSLPVVAY